MENKKETMECLDTGISREYQTNMKRKVNYKEEGIKEDTPANPGGSGHGELYLGKFCFILNLLIITKWLIGEGVKAFMCHQCHN